MTQECLRCHKTGIVANGEKPILWPGDYGEGFMCWPCGFQTALDATLTQLFQQDAD